MNVVDLANEYLWKPSIVPAVYTDTATGRDSQDMGNTGPEVGAVANVGVNAGDDTVVAIKLQESDSGTGDWSDIPDATFDAIAGDEENLTRVKWFKNRSKKYVRALATFTGTSESVALCVNLVGRKQSYSS
jgi:hypothetical protein